MQEQESKQADYNSAIARLKFGQRRRRRRPGRRRPPAGAGELQEHHRTVRRRGDRARDRHRRADQCRQRNRRRSGPELFRVADIHMMRIYVQVPQQLSAGIKAGLTADLHLPQYPNKTFKATVATTSSAINTQCAHASGRAARRKSGRRAAARRLCAGRFRAAEQSQHGAHPDQRARVPRARDGGRHRSGQAIRSSSSRSRSGAISEPRSRCWNGLTLSDRLVNSPPDSLATGDKVRVAGAEGASTEGATSNAGGQETAAAPGGAKPH